MKDLHQAILGDLRDRSRWVERQVKWYEMRHNGLPRKSMPWPGASDLHFALADSMIEKQKPSYSQQIYATDLIASFISYRLQSTKFTEAAARWFDYKIKQKSNLETELLTSIDHMLMSGKAIVKIFWNAKKKRLCFDAVDPIYFVVPWWTKDLQDTDRAVHIHRLSIDAYKRDDLYNHDEDLIRRVTGIDNSSSISTSKDQSAYSREGITRSRDQNEIIVWETYERSSHGWNIHFFSPLAPNEPLRPSIQLPYRHGELPFVDFRMEIKDKGYYSPRGIPEIIAPFEASLNKIWNDKHDAMTLLNRPIFTTEGQITNAQNIRLTPGQLIQGNIKPVIQPSPAISWDQEMVNIRMIAEYRIGMPDFGTGQTINTKERKTATEVNRITSMMGQGMDLRARIFRKSLSTVFAQAWSLLLQYDHQDLRYFYLDELLEAPLDALHEDYRIAPNGSADNYNREMIQQKAIARMQMFQNNPFVNQGALVKSVIELDDPRLVKTLYLEPQQASASQAEEQAEEICSMLIGFPVQANVTDDHTVHLETMGQFVERRMHTGEPITPELATLLLQHGGQHHEMLQKTNPAAFKQIQPDIEHTTHILNQLLQPQK